MLWAKVCVRAHSDKKIRKAGPFAWQAYEAMVRMAKERNQSGLVPFDQCDGEELAFWTNLHGFEFELEAALQGLCSTGALVVDEDGLRIAAWEKHNPDKTNAERQRRYRQRQKEQASVTVTGRDVTPVTSDDVTLDKSRVEESREGTNARAREGGTSAPGAAALADWNEQAGGRLKSQAFIKAANARVKDGATLDDLKLVTRWALTAPDAKYLRDGNHCSPDTLWRPSKFPKYLAAAEKWRDRQKPQPSKPPGEAPVIWQGHTALYPTGRPGLRQDKNGRRYVEDETGWVEVEEHEVRNVEVRS
jgi:hypothetical protein